MFIKNHIDYKIIIIKKLPLIYESQFYSEGDCFRKVNSVRDLHSQNLGMRHATDFK